MPPRNEKLVPVYEMVRDMDLFHRIPELKALDGKFALRDGLHVVAAECGESNAFYTASTDEVVLCYELVKDSLDKGKKHARQEKLGQDFVDGYFLSAMRMTVLHELGHALIDQLDLPITGREESAADEFAAAIMLQHIDHTEASGDVEGMLMLGGYDMIDDIHGRDPSLLADSHELGEQRYFNVLCVIYGSDPSGYLSLVTEEGLPQERASTCPEYSARVMSTWYQLLNPHLAPKYQMSKEDWYKRADEGRVAQGKNDSIYVR